MQRLEPLDFDQLSARIEQGHRRALLRTMLLSFAIVAVAAAVLLFTLNAIRKADGQLNTLNQQLNGLQQQIAAADDAKEKAQGELKSAREQAATLQAQGATLRAQAATLQAQTATLQAQVNELKSALADALNLKKHVYNLNWAELKLIAVENGPATEVLEVIQNLKDNTRWGLSNTAAGGYNSPGFAELVLQRLHRLPAAGGLGGLPRDDGSPRAGDIVVYDSGYHLFYFRDHEKREFVVGMTPLGVVSLNYDFDTGRAGVLRTGFTQR
jgi:hypothetical protein